MNCKECGIKLGKSSCFYLNTKSRIEYLCASCYTRLYKSFNIGEFKKWIMYQICSKCGYGYPYILNEIDDELVCDICARKSADAEITTRSNSLVLIGTSFEKNNFTDYVGIELETEPKEGTVYEDIFSSDKGYKLWARHHDGSIGDDGVEFVSPAMRGDQLVEEVNRFCELINKHEFRVTPRCGTHIHIDFSDNTEEETLKFLKLCKKFEKEISLMVPLSRCVGEWADRYCRKIPVYWNIEKAKSLKQLACNIYKHNSFDRAMVDAHTNMRHPERYTWLNPHAYFYNDRRTIEIRNHPGTINATKILNWILIFLTLKRKALSMEIEEIDGLTPDESNSTFMSLFDSNLQSYIISRMNTFRRKK